MLGIDISMIMHELNIGPLVKPIIAWRKRVVGEEKKIVIHVEIGKLTDTNFFKYIRFHT